MVFFGCRVNRDVLADGFQKFAGDEAEVLVTDYFNGAIVDFEGVVGGDFVIVKMIAQYCRKRGKSSLRRQTSRTPEVSIFSLLIGQSATRASQDAPDVPNLPYKGTAGRRPARNSAHCSSEKGESNRA